ncbi:MAG: SHOCT domain-containing protein [Armatimonadota bacterium]
MLIATFNASTGWSGKTITFENEQFILGDHGRISATDVLAYDRQGQLTWAYQGLSEWVVTRARASAVPTAVPRRPQGFEWHTATGSPGGKPTGLQTPWGILTPLTMVGLLLIIIGLIVAVGAIGSDVSVPTDYGDRVNNIGLMNDQRNGIVGGLIVAVIGGVLLVIAYARGELDDWVKRAPAGAGRTGADGWRSPAGNRTSQAAASPPLVTPPSYAALHAAAQTAAVAPPFPVTQSARIAAAPMPLVAQPDPSRDPETALIEPQAPTVVAELTKLANLHARGMLTDEEFAAFKAKLME